MISPVPRRRAFPCKGFLHALAFPCNRFCKHWLLHAMTFSCNVRLAFPSDRSSQLVEVLPALESLRDGDRLLGWVMCFSDGGRGT